MRGEDALLTKDRGMGGEDALLTKDRGWEGKMHYHVKVLSQVSKF